MDRDDPARVHASSMKAGVFAAVMLVSFCFTIAIMMSGSTSIAASPELETTERHP